MAPVGRVAGTSVPVARPSAIRSPPAMHRATALAALAALASLAMSSPSVPSPQPRRPIVIAHRGASGYLPEHTLAAYELAVEQGADYIEPDLVITRDGVLIARHENEIGETTDVGTRFPQRQTTKRVDGEEVTGWFAEDFTLAEIKTLRARERLAYRSQARNGEFEVPTFEEILELVARLEREQGRRVGLYPETKHPSYFRRMGLPLEEPLLDALHRRGYRTAEDPVFIQSFEVGNLRDLHNRTGLRLIQLLDDKGAPWDFVAADDPRTYATLATPAGLREIASYAAGIGPHKRLIVPQDARGGLGSPTGLVADAHAAGLAVHPWTFRSEALFLHRDYAGDPLAELRQFLELGVDGVFADFPDVAVRARDH
ncbi:MAG TPA: glycerophosphodiester phosphodiesterase [Gemmatimonadales bacterium]|nr:glycerophosphodiester phosphodiesterase [Gemmatimonadales bacterium]